jgi:hypothetical protein
MRKTLNVLPPGLYSICDGCQEPTPGSKLTPVYRPQQMFPKYKRATKDWLCPTCLRGERRGENEPEIRD